MFNKKNASLIIMLLVNLMLVGCSSGGTQTNTAKKAPQIFAKSIQGQVNRGDSASVIRALESQHNSWRGTRYRIGGTTRKGIDCSGFTQVTFRQLFGIELPRMTVDQARVGVKVSKSNLKAGDLVLFKTGRGPNGKHVGIYVENGKFLHASTKGGVIYSDIDSPYWARTFWQARRI